MAADDGYDDYDGDYEDDHQEDENDSTLTSALSDQMGAAPWYVSSVAIHSVIFLILLLIPVPIKEPEAPRLIITTDVVEEEEEPEEEPAPEIEKKEQEIDVESEVEIDAPVVIKTTQVEICDHFETDDDMDNNTALGDPDCISDVDAEFAGTPALMGVGNSGGKGGGGRFGYRNGGGKRNAVRRGGGSKRTESAVDWALRWLAAHQEYDGHWDCKKYGGGQKKGDDNAVTSLALLAFLGAGNSTKFGKYRSNVKRAVDYLLSQQREDGGCEPYKYTSGIYLMALAEAYGMSETPALKAAAQKAVDRAVSGQADNGSWGYKPNTPRADTSVTGWWIMGLKSAKVAYLDVPDKTMKKALEYMQKATPDKGGRASYASKNGEIKKGGGSHRMAAVALTCLQFLGQDRHDPQVKGSAEYCCKRLPVAGSPDFYETYYQALGLFQMGVRSEYWTRFNEPMKAALLSSQVKEGTFEQNKGSWNPDGDRFGPSWGRVGQTALGALMLEIYYRYKEVQP